MSLRQDFVQILNESHEAIWKRFDFAKSLALGSGLAKSSAAKWKGPGEPALAYGVMDSSTCDEIADAITKRLNGVSPGQTLATFYFIHQKPKVDYINKANIPVQIELGDLLFIRHHFKSGSVTPEGRAFILQAKVNTSPTTGGLSADDVKQLELYQDWSLGFTFPHGEFGLPKNGAKWDFSQGTQSPVSQTGAYGVVLSKRQNGSLEKKFSDQCVWGVGFPDKAKTLRKRPSVPADSISLAKALDGLINGGFGRTWVTNPTDQNDHWSQFINDALSSADMKSSRASLNRINSEVLRVQDVVSFAATIPGLLHLIDNTTSHGIFIEKAKALRLVFDWKNSLTSDGNDGPPSDSENSFAQSPPRSGMSFIYIVTFEGHKPE